MKAGIITFHFPYNCGAVLQCLALQTALEKLGAEVEVIDYRPWYHQNRYTPLKNPVYFAKKCLRKRGPNDTKPKRIIRALDGGLRSVYAWRKYPMLSKQDRLFTDFRAAFLNETKVYRSIGQLQENPPACDIYISGSDQLWNAKLTEGSFDSAYFLDFGDSDTGRITFSVGADFSVMKDPHAKLVEYLGKIQAISLRETKCVDEIRAACNEIGDQDKEIHIDLDPTFLLEGEEYHRFMADSVNEEEPYILTYTMPNKVSQVMAYDVAKEFSRKTGLRIIDVSGNPNATNRTIPDHRTCSPSDFLTYVHKAEYVVTNSFHGTAFSINFKKNFVSIPHAETGNRVTELLDKLSLGDRWHASPEEAIEALQKEVDYSTCYSTLDSLKSESLDYLSRCLDQFARKNRIES